MIARRSLFLLPAALLAAADSTIQGVRLGVSGYSFQGFSLDEAIAAMNKIGLSRLEAEVFRDAACGPLGQGVQRAACQ